MDLAPDLSEDMQDSYDFLIVILYKDKRIIELNAKAESTKDLREIYIRMLTGMAFKDGVTIQVYKKIDDEWQIVEEHLF